MIRRHIQLVAFAAVLLAGCSRAVQVGSSTNGVTYAVNVSNISASPLQVSFNDGTDHFLGTVNAGKTERFVVAGASSQIVSILGRATTGSRTSGPVRVNLVAGTAVNVTLR